MSADPDPDCCPVCGAVVYSARAALHRDWHRTLSNRPPRSEP